MNSNPSRTEAIRTRVSTGLSTDSIHIRAIEKSPGLTIYQLAKILDFSLGRIDGSINRMLSKKLIQIEYTMRGGKSSKQVYPINYIPSIEHEIRIAKKEYRQTAKLVKALTRLCTRRNTNRHLSFRERRMGKTFPECRETISNN